ncbi:MAG: FAD/NAD(P)-binding protein [Ferruginibacter sp.]
MRILETKKQIAIIGGGPSGMFLYKRLLEYAGEDFTVDIFEAKEKLGNGMPYSNQGANIEHITNVSGNEIPPLVTPVVEWVTSLPEDTLKKYSIDVNKLTEFMVLPRLLFGDYLSAQFDLLQQKASVAGVKTFVHLNSKITDVIDVPGRSKVIIEIGGKDTWEFDHVIICTGHNWPLTHEGKVPGYFDSPYPPSKLKIRIEHEIAIRGSSLTAIDAIRTLARHNGVFVEEGPHKLSFAPNEDAQNFKIIMHTREGLLPGIRFHLDDPRLSNDSLLSKEDILCHMQENNGFLSLDFIFEKDFKNSFRDKDPQFYERLKDLSIEEFVCAVMGMRERADPFQLFKAEYAEAKKSIQRRESVYWKEMLAVLSFAMNYPAKHFTAEDMRRLQKVLMPLISIVIAFVPQSSCEELIALHDAGRLELIPVGEDSHIEVCTEGGIVYHYIDEDGDNKQKKYKSYVDCVGQRHLSLEEFPFQSLVRNGTISPARIKFNSAENALSLYNSGDKDVEPGHDNHYYLKVPGIAITDTFRAIEKSGNHNPRIYVMAVPYIGGYNPDYSGLDFCEEASNLIVSDMFQEENWKRVV